MPVSTKVGPDGCFWVLDWYDRYHCYQDANRDPDGIDRQRGRLWRVVYGHVPTPKPFDVGRKSNSELVALLSHPNGWWRRTAQRILIERNDSADVERLEALARSSAPNNAPMHAVWTLIGMRRITPAFHTELLGHPSPTFRAWGVRAACEMGAVSDGIFERIRVMATDPSPDVRLEVTVASSRLRHPASLSLLLGTLAYREDDPLIPHIAWENLHPRVDADRRAIVSWLTDEMRLSTEGSREVARRAIGLLVPRMPDDTDAFSSLLSAGLKRGDDSLLLRYCVEALWQKTSQAADRPSSEAASPATPLFHESLAQLTSHDGECGALATAILTASKDPLSCQRARQFARETHRPIALRQRMLSALAIARDDAVLDLAGQILTASSDPPELKRQVLTTLQSLDDPNVGPLLIELWPQLAPDLHPAALGVLCTRVAWAQSLLRAIENGQIPKSELNTTHVRQMLRHGHAELTAAIERTWGRLRDERSPDRQQVIREMSFVVKTGKGDPANGQRLFKTHCAQCHKIYGHGMDIGPDITGNGRSDLEQILSNVLDPNLVIGSGYITRTVWTHDDQVFNGILLEDSPRGVVLKIAGTTEPQFIPRSDIEEMRVSEVSLMPEGVEEGMTRQEFRDLVSFLLTREPPLPWEQIPEVAETERKAEEAGPDAPSGAR